MKKAGYDRYLEGVIKKGCKGDPSKYYKMYNEKKMTGKEIRELIVGRTMTGFILCMQWSIKINKNNESEMTIFSKVHKGKIWVEGDTLCQQYKTSRSGLKSCAEIYKNPEGNKKTLSEYFWLTDFMLYPFSIEE